MPIQILQPVVVDGQTFLSLVVQSAGSLIIKVLDVRGMIAKTFTATVSEESTEYKIDVKDLPQGKYVLNAFNGDSFLRCIRFIKQ